MRAATAVLALIFLAACTRTLELTRLTDGATGTGTLDLSARSVTVILPSGETARGAYTKLTTDDIRSDSLFHGANLADLLGTHQTERLYVYAQLTGEQGTKVEMVLTVDWLGHGFGVARAGGREDCRVTF